jgi:hypothetical protein
MLRRPKGQSAKLSLGVSGKAALKASNPWSRGCNPAPDSHNSRQSELDKVCIRPDGAKILPVPACNQGPESRRFVQQLPGFCGSGFCGLGSDTA